MVIRLINITTPPPSIALARGGIQYFRILYQEIDMIFEFINMINNLCMYYINATRVIY